MKPTLDDLTKEIAEANILLGNWQAHMEIATKFRQKAGEAFADAQDEYAHLLREVAQKIAQAGAEKRTLYDEEVKYRHEAALRALKEIPVLATLEEGAANGQ